MEKSSGRRKEKGSGMKTVKVEIEPDKEFEIKVADKDIDTLLKVISTFEKKEKA